MIDTDKYEGHTRGPWEWSYSDDVAAQLLIIPNGNDGISNGVCIGLGDADAQLIADAPLILEDYKRLREAIEETVYSWRDKPWGVMGHTIAIALRNAGEDILNILYGGEEE